MKAGPSISVEDDFDRLSAVEHPNGDKVVHLYDSGGLRKERVLADGEKVESFFSGLPTMNENSSGGDSFSYLMGHQLMGFEKNGNFNYFVTDGLSTVRLVLNSSGTAVTSFEPDEFGNELASSGSSPKTYVGGLGVHNDTADTGLLYMRARHYDGRLGRFLNRDPIGFAGDLNLFNYSASSPMNFVDPTGLRPRSRRNAPPGYRMVALYTGDGSGYHLDPNAWQIRPETPLERATRAYKTVALKRRDGPRAGQICLWYAQDIFNELNRLSAQGSLGDLQPTIYGFARSPLVELGTGDKGQKCPSPESNFCHNVAALKDADGNLVAIFDPWLWYFALDMPLVFTDRQMYLRHRMTRGDFREWPAEDIARARRTGRLRP